jgi:hypothetical protein
MVNNVLVKEKRSLPRNDGGYYPDFTLFVMGLRGRSLLKRKTRGVSVVTWCG